MGPSLCDYDCLRGADAVAGFAFGAVVLVDIEFVPQFHDGIEGACLFAEPAEDAVFRPDAESSQTLAALRAAVSIVYVLFVFFAEIFNRGQNGIRCAVPEAAERT